jgi:hypothetical protein
MRKGCLIYWRNIGDVLETILATYSKKASDISETIGDIFEKVRDISAVVDVKYNSITTTIEPNNIYAAPLILLIDVLHSSSLGSLSEGKRGNVEGSSLIATSPAVSTSNSRRFSTCRRFLVISPTRWFHLE